MVRRRLTVIALSAVVGLGIALHEQPRERAWAAAHLPDAAPTLVHKG